jgi:hypothetical protein
MSATSKRPLQLELMRGQKSVVVALEFYIGFILAMKLGHLMVEEAAY